MFSKIKFEVGVGLVFLVAMLFLGYYTIIMGRKTFNPSETYRVQVHFPHTEGLRKTDKVTINGVVSGEVENIKLQEKDVVVTLKMYNQLNLYDNYLIKVNSESMMAGKRVSIYPGQALDQDGQNHRKLSLDEELQGRVEDPLASVTTLIEENRDNIHQTLKNIREITDKINSGEGTIGKLINEDTVHSKATNLLKDMDEAIEDSREQAPITSFLKAAMTVF